MAAVLAAIVAACLGCLIAGCEPPDDSENQPPGTFEVDFSTPHPITPWSDDS